MSHPEEQPVTRTGGMWDPVKLLHNGRRSLTGWGKQQVGVR